MSTNATSSSPEPSEAGAGGGGASLDNVAEEILNLLFCHYEPPTSDEAQIKAAQKVSANHFSSWGTRNKRNLTTLRRHHSTNEEATPIKSEE